MCNAAPLPQEGARTPVVRERTGSEGTKRVGS